MSQASRTAHAEQRDVESRRGLAELPAVARFITWPLVTIVLIHTLLIGLWVAPSTPVRDVVGQERVREYVQPWFDQNWSIFAPNPRSTAVTFEVRASIRPVDGGELEVTEWVDLIDIEDSILAGNPIPPRTDKIARRTTDRIHTAVRAMNSEQREWLEVNYTRTSVEELRDGLASAGAGASTIDRYMTADGAATRIASAFAEVEWVDEGELMYIQYRTSTRSAPDWNDSEEQSLDDASRTQRDYGWRRGAEVDRAGVEHFQRYLEQGDV